MPNICHGAAQQLVNEGRVKVIHNREDDPACNLSSESSTKKIQSKSLPQTGGRNNRSAREYQRRARRAVTENILQTGRA